MVEVESALSPASDWSCTVPPDSVEALAAGSESVDEPPGYSKYPTIPVITTPATTIKPDVRPGTAVMGSKEP